MKIIIPDFLSLPKRNVVLLILLTSLLLTACAPVPAAVSIPATAPRPTATALPTTAPTPTAALPPTIQPTKPGDLLQEVALSQASKDTTAILDSLGGYPCPNSDFTCVDVTVPLDHTQPPAQPQDGGTIKVVFGVLPANGERKGMFVTVTGGPGTSGLLSADSYTSAFDPSIPEHFDIVFFDQRGVGLSGGLQCA